MGYYAHLSAIQDSWGRDVLTWKYGDESKYLDYKLPDTSSQEAILQQAYHRNEMMEYIEIE